MRITDIKNGKANWLKLPFSNINEYQLLTYQIQKDGIFIARTAGTIGKYFRLNEYKDNFFLLVILLDFHL